MSTRQAACHCGQLRLEVTGDPFVVSICHCLDCQRRTGSAFGMQSAFRPDQVEVVGRFNDYSRISDEADEKEHVFHFCPDCGSQVFYTEPTEPDLIVISVGSFADPAFPPPTESGYNTRRHEWLDLPASIGSFAPELWWPVHPLYESGRYAEAADRGRELLEAHPQYPDLAYNVACCESLAGRSADAIEHLRLAIDGASSSVRWPPATRTSIRSATSRVQGTGQLALALFIPRATSRSSTSPGTLPRSRPRSARSSPRPRPLSTTAGRPSGRRGRAGTPRTLYFGGSGVISAIDRLQRRGLVELERDYGPYLDREYMPDYPEDDHQLACTSARPGSASSSSGLHPRARTPIASQS